MKSWSSRLLALAAVVAGGVVGYLNDAVVTVDLVWLRFESRLGVVLLGAFACGLLGGLLWGLLSAARHRSSPIADGTAQSDKPRTSPARD